MKKHNHTSNGVTSPTYITWQGMKNRVLKPQHAGYSRYGGRGITLWPTWHNFESFLADMGARPLGMTLDRINTNGDYTPNNCRWVPRRDQMSNMRSNRYITFSGMTRTLSEWSRSLGVPISTLWERLESGKELKDVLRPFTRTRRGMTHD